MEFHAHIYYDPSTRDSAESLRDVLLWRRLPGLRVGPLEDSLRGPHAKPMFELRFATALFSEVVLWLMFHRGEHAVLIHAVTGSDPVDHDSYRLWLGDPLPLDKSRLDAPGVSRVPDFKFGNALMPGGL